MTLTEQLKSWYAKFQKNTVKYKNGFFHMYNVANSPRTMIESFDKMPFVKHSPEKKMMTTATLFLNVQMYYAELEEGLCVMVSNLEYKKNLVMHNIFEESVPIKYNFINLHYNQKPFISKSMLINGMVLNDKTWSVFKAGKAKQDYHFKNSHEFNITIYFTDEWLASNHESKPYFNGSNFEKFLKSNNDYVFLPDLSLTSDDFYAKFLEVISSNGDCSKNGDLKKMVAGFFIHFIEKYNLETINENHFNLTDKDRKHIQKTEKYLHDNLLRPFPGIEALSKTIGVSPTKLKTEFKMIYNQSIFQYYRYQQMQLASQLLKEKARTVKEVANLLGYESSSKFAAAFKEQFGIQPSSLIKEKVD